MTLHDTMLAPSSHALRRRTLALGAKRGMDLGLSVAALVFFAPLLIGIAVAVRATSAGPVLFRQEREGRDGRPFPIFKFRTMYAPNGDASGIEQTVAGDARVTPIGRVLRRLSLDELPQLLNVVRGEMSLVGPRPHVAGMLAGGVPYVDLVPGYRRRLTIRPGITGLAQVQGLRGPTIDAGRAVARVQQDLDYIERWSLGLDCRIIALTLWREILGGTGS